MIMSNLAELMTDKQIRSSAAAWLLQMEPVQEQSSKICQGGKTEMVSWKEQSEGFESVESAVR